MLHDVGAQAALGRFASGDRGTALPLQGAEAVLPGVPLADRGPQKRWPIWTRRLFALREVATRGAQAVGVALRDQLERHPGVQRLQLGQAPAPLPRRPGERPQGVLALGDGPPEPA